MEEEDMKRIWLLVSMLVVFAVLAGCAPAATPVPAQPEPTQPPVAEPTQAPAAPEPTQAPAAPEPTQPAEPTQPPAAAQEEITLSVFTQAPGAYPTIFPVVIKNFENKHPGVKVDLRVVGYGEYQSSLASMIAAGQPPDVFLENQGGDTWGVAQAGEVLDLTPYLDANNGEWRKQMYDYIPGLLSWDGKTYCIAASLNNLQMMISRAALEKYGLEEPKTTDDLIAMAGALKGKGVAPVAFATADLWGAVDMFTVFVHQQGGGDLLKKADMGEEKWSGNPIFINAMKTIKDLNDAGVFMEGASAMNYHEDALPAWIQGNSIMLWPGGNFMIQDIPAEVNADAIWFPTMPGGKPVLTGGTALVWCASSKTQHKDLAVDLLKELTTQETYEIMFKNGVAPAGPLAKEVKSEYPLADKVNAQQGDAVDRFIYTPQTYQEVAVAVQGLMAGDLTPEQAVDKIQAASDSAYKK
jgi:raffinose/stachyose/melibiose transport system substrate-binding protein